jgi:uncharacterized Ntn-hydrolase superfamily protein
MKNYFLVLFILCTSLLSTAQDTFSIIAIDPATGEIGSAAASCVPGVTDPNFIDWLTAIIPNRGGVMSQASICVPNPNLANAITQMDAGDSPSEIINFLIANDACGVNSYNPEYRQYGIVDFDGSGNLRTAGFTGNQNQSYAEDRQGSNYSIQGNILLDVSVIDNMEANFNNTTGTLADKLMAALQGANFPGADSRCLENGTSSRLAFLTVYRPDDDPGDPFIRLSVTSQPDGIEPIDVLQDLYTQFLNVSDFELASKFKLFPNPGSNLITLEVHDSVNLVKVSIYDITGKLLMEPVINESSNINISQLSSGMYFAKVVSEQGSISIKFIKQ